MDDDAVLSANPSTPFLFHFRPGSAIHTEIIVSTTPSSSTSRTRSAGWTACSFLAGIACSCLVFLIAAIIAQPPPTPILYHN